MALEDPESIDEILMAQPYMSSNDLAFMGAGEVEVEGWFFATRMVDEFTLRSHPILRNYPYDPSWGDSMDMRREGFLAIVAVTPIGATEDRASEREREAKEEMEIGDALKIEAGSAAAPHPGPVDRRPGALAEPARRGRRQVPGQQPVRRSLHQGQEDAA